MKRVALVMSLFFMSFFVSGYTFESEMIISNDNKVTFNKTFTFERAEITKEVCGPTTECEYGETEIRNAISKYVNGDIVNSDVKKTQNISIEDNYVSINTVYEFGDIDDHVGPAKEKFDIIYSKLNNDLFTIDGYNYTSNLVFTKDQNLTLGTFKLILPNPIKSCNASKKDDNNHSYEWELEKTPNINFVYKAESNKEITGDSEYGKIEFNKYMYIAVGVICGLIIILAFVNIIKKNKNDKKNEVIPATASTVFNSETNNTITNSPIPTSSTDDNGFIPLDASQHEDVISNKFMDDSFAGGTVVEPITEPEIKEQSVDSNNNLFDEQQNNQESINEGEVKAEPIGNDMSSLAFGGTPIEDKNIHEIE